jgi:hypothetical protein
MFDGVGDVRRIDLPRLAAITMPTRRMLGPYGSGAGAKTAQRSSSSRCTAYTFMPSI